ncbi:MAG: T9SS type A sorting domain-containing protein [Crocinitomix sp.]|nr:T9SS type A sorting domain-containing protein [Crocinitomix sp.]
MTYIMKKIYAIIILTVVSSIAFGQVSFTIFEPASIAGGYEFTSNGDGPNWGLENLDDPADAVTDTVVIADDGTPGINAQGVPHANEACGPLITDVTGKIVLLYRYDGESDNDCYAGTKVLNAQNAGAIGVILVNRDNSVYGYNGTDDGPLTTIPFAFITKDDGALIRERIDAGEDVVAFIGNKLGLYADDAGIVNRSTMAPVISAATMQTSVDASEFGFDVGTTIYNYGSNMQSDVLITATVTGPPGTWTETSGPFEIESGDSIEVYTDGPEDLPYFSFDSYPAGNYTLTYEVDLGTADESSFDNTISFNFIMNDSMVSYCKIDEETNEFSVNRVTRSGTSVFSPCLVFDNPNGNRLGAAGIYFIAESAWNVDLLLEGEEMGIILYEWNDEFEDLDDAAFGFTDLDDVAEATYTFGEGEESQVAYAAFDEPVLLEDDQRYLACLQVWNPNIWIAYNSQVDYARNIARDRQPLTPISSDGDFFALGFGEEMAPAMGLHVFNAAELNVAETTDELGINVYPNPTSGLLNVVFTGNEFSAETIHITDLSGRIVRTVNVNGLMNQIDISQLGAGQYILLVEGSEGTKGQYAFTKL